MAAPRKQSEKKISSELVNLEMRDDYYPQWFELFEALGLDRKKLEYMRDEYAKDPKVCMYEASRQWFQQGDPKPSWELICYVLRYKLLDPVHADRIEGILGLSDIPNPLLTQPVSGERHKISEEEITDLYGKGDDSPFGDLLMEVIDEFTVSPSSYTVSFYVNTLCCPDASPMIDSNLIRYKTSIDGVLLPLVLHNFFSHYDIDFLIYLLEAFHKKQILMPHIDTFLSKRTLGDPYVRAIRNLRKNFLVRCVFDQTAPGLNWESIKIMKQKLRILFHLENFPYILHFIGWSVNPLSICYQLPLPCMHSVRSALENFPPVLTEAKVIKAIIEIGTTKFPYNST